jgi:hypothetical protein
MSENVWAMFGTLPGGDKVISVDDSIERGLTYFCDQDQRAIRKKIDDDATAENRLHIFREISAGVFLTREGFTVRYSPRVYGKTPDWRCRANAVHDFIAEIVNLHVEKGIKDGITQALESGLPWSGEIPDQVKRLYESLSKKAAKYHELADRMRVPYVVFVFPWFDACGQPQQVKDCLFPTDLLFDKYPTLSGVYHMNERPYKSTATFYFNGTQWVVEPKAPDLDDPKAGYLFEFHANPEATYPKTILSSWAVSRLGCLESAGRDEGRPGDCRVVSATAQ